MGWRGGYFIVGGVMIRSIEVLQGWCYELLLNCCCCCTSVMAASALPANALHV